jgi:hypothetical protein
MNDQRSPSREPPWWVGKAKRHHILLNFIIICAFIAGMLVLAVILASQQQWSRLALHRPTSRRRSWLALHALRRRDRPGRRHLRQPAPRSTRLVHCWGGLFPTLHTEPWSVLQW